MKIEADYLVLGSGIAASIWAASRCRRMGIRVSGAAIYILARIAAAAALPSIPLMEGMGGRSTSWTLGAAVILCWWSMSHAEPLPLFIDANHGDGDAREAKARQPLWFDAGDSAWQPQIPPRGERSGETTVRVNFPVAGRRLPVRFGIPLGQVPSARNVALFDESGREVPADVFPLVNFDTSPLHWVLIATVLDAPAAGESTLSIRWGPDVERSDPQRSLTTVESATEVCFSGGSVDFTLSATGLVSNVRVGEELFAPSGGKVGFDIKARQSSRSAGPGTYRHKEDSTVIEKLFDGPFYKRYRVSSAFFHSDALNRPFRLHFEVETWADSPYLMIHSRFINETFKEIMSDLVLFSFEPDGGEYAAVVSGMGDAEFAGGAEMSARQRRSEWVVRADDTDLATGFENDLGEWARISRGGEAVTLVVPDFQGFGPAEPDLESVLSATADGGLELRHYRPLEGAPTTDTGGTITFWNSAARTFRMALHAGPDSLTGAVVAVPIREPPSIVYDRDFLTSQGTFVEDRVTSTYDEVSLEGTRYFDRARAVRQDYPRLGRGMPPQKGEGFEKPYTNTGGMLFGEVWQYMEPNGAWNKTWIPKQKSEGNLPGWYEPVHLEGFATYRVGDHAMAMAISYLRRGDRQVFDIFRDHAMLYADWAVSHPTGSVHYYANWTGKSQVYVRLAGPIIAYLVDGDPWLLETAEQMGANLTRRWNGDNPSDRESRSAYPARGLTWLYEVTGHWGYWNEAVDRVLWFLDGALTPDGQVRGVIKDDGRLSMLYAGYSLVGLSNVHERTGNESLLAAMKKVGDWLIRVQGKYDGPFSVNTGTWAADEKRGSRSMVGPGNVGTTTLCAEVQTYLAQVTGEQQYFYSGAAAWANMVTSSRHNWIKGGLPMQTENRWRTGTWSDKLAPYLHRMPALAEKKGWPFVVEGVFDPDAKEGKTVVVFVGAEGHFENGALVQPMFTGNKVPVQIPLWSPSRPTRATYNEKEIEISSGIKRGISLLTLPGNAPPGILRVDFAPAVPTSVEAPTARPLRSTLEQSYPNPFNSGTLIPYSVHEPTEIELAVYNLSGQKLIALRRGPSQPGRHIVPWDGRDEAGNQLASGVYLYRLRIGDWERVRKLLLLR